MESAPRFRSWPVAGNTDRELMQSTNTPSDSSLGNVYRVLRKHGIWRQVPIVVGLLLTGVLDAMRSEHALGVIP